MTPCCQVTSTFPDQTLAEQVAQQLVAERLAACVQVHGPVASIYQWQGAVERAAEWYCHCKTTMARLPDLRRRIRELHPYEVAEIIAVPILDGDPAYLQWIEESVSSAT